MIESLSNYVVIKSGDLIGIVGIKHPSSARTSLNFATVFCELITTVQTVGRFENSTKSGTWR